MSPTRTDGSVMVAGERFEAWCACPSCERFACHRIRRPKVPAGIAPWERKLGKDTRPHDQRISNWHELGDAVQEMIISIESMTDDLQSWSMAPEAPSRDPRSWASEMAWKPLRGAVLIAEYAPKPSLGEGFRRGEALTVEQVKRAIMPRIPAGPLREWEYDIIRTCDCGHEWGQV